MSQHNQKSNIASTASELLNKNMDNGPGGGGKPPMSPGGGGGKLPMVPAGGDVKSNMDNGGGGGH